MSPCADRRPSATWDQRIGAIHWGKHTTSGKQVCRRQECPPPHVQISEMGRSAGSHGAPRAPAQNTCARPGTLKTGREGRSALRFACQLDMQIRLYQPSRQQEGPAQRVVRFYCNLYDSVQRAGRDRELRQASRARNTLPAIPIPVFAERRGGPAKRRISPDKTRKNSARRAASMAPKRVRVTGSWDRSARNAIWQDDSAPAPCGRASSPEDTAARANTVFSMQAHGNAVAGHTRVRDRAPSSRHGPI